jgi:hypothetical protein
MKAHFFSITYQLTIMTAYRFVRSVSDFITCDAIVAHLFTDKPHDSNRIARWLILARSHRLSNKAPIASTF